MKPCPFCYCQFLLKASEGSRTDNCDESAPSNLKSRALGWATAHIDPLCLHWLNHLQASAHITLAAWHCVVTSCGGTGHQQLTVKSIETIITHSQCGCQPFSASISHGKHRRYSPASWPPFVMQKWHLIWILEIHLKLWYDVTQQKNSNIKQLEICYCFHYLFLSYTIYSRLQQSV